jgi:phosphatidylglycerophosphatase A
MLQPDNTSSAASGGTIHPVVRIFATGLYTGYSPIASGTAGSLLACAVYCIPGFERPVVLAGICVVTFFLGVLASARMERALGEDPSVVVIDEVVGMWISLFLLPKTIAALVLAFLLFRLFDILKPPPARQSERYRNGWGIMTDDVIAGVYANLAGRGFIFVFPSLFLSNPFQ